MHRKSIHCSRYVIDTIGQLIEKNNIWLYPSNTLVFLCGADKNKQGQNARRDFFYYANKHLKDFKFFFAEDVFINFEEKSVDLLTIENILANYSDCILILLESDGAKVELGAFSSHSGLIKKILVINDKKFKSEKSFISLGPIKKIRAQSYFSEVYYTKFETVSEVFGKIEKVLSPIKQTNCRKLDIKDYDALQAQHQKRLFFIADLIWIFSPITYSELISIMQMIFGVNKSYDFIKLDLAFLHSIEWIERSSSNERPYFKGKSFVRSFCKFGFNSLEFSLRLSALRYIQKNSHYKSNILVEHING